MPNTLSKNAKTVKANRNKKLTGWDRAIADAKRGILSLKRAMETFKARKKAGEPWPGDDKKNQQQGVTGGGVR